MARKTQQRSLRQPEITIIGEGATERFYFTNLRRLKGYRYTCKPRNFTEQSLDEIQKQVDRVLVVIPTAFELNVLALFGFYLTHILITCQLYLYCCLLYHSTSLLYHRYKASVLAIHVFCTTGTKHLYYSHCVSSSVLSNLIS